MKPYTKSWKTSCCKAIRLEWWFAFQDDDDLKHTVRRRLEWLQNKPLTVLEWPLRTSVKRPEDGSSQNTCYPIFPFLSLYILTYPPVPPSFYPSSTRLFSPPPLGSPPKVNLQKDHYWFSSLLFPHLQPFLPPLPLISLTALHHAFYKALGWLVQAFIYRGVFNLAQCGVKFEVWDEINGGRTCLNCRII